VAANRAVGDDTENNALQRSSHELVVGDVYVRARNRHQDRAARVSAEPIVVDRGVAELKVRLDAVALAGAGIAVVLDHVLLYQRRAGGAVGVQLDASDVVLNDVVDYLEASVCS